MNQLVIHVSRGALKISRHHCGRFAEHPGTGIYEGLWMGEDSPIPKTRNTFTQPDAVVPGGFTGWRLNGKKFVVDLPARSVAALKIQ